MLSALKMHRLRNHFVIYLCAFTGPLAGNAILVMLDELEMTFEVSLGQVLIAIPTFMLPFAILQLFSGTISDNWERKMTMVVGMLLYGLSSIGIAIVDNYPIFLLMRVGQGVGFAFVGPVSIAYLGDITDRSKYGIAMGFYGSAVTAGLSVGPLIAGFLAAIDWRLAFWAFSSIAFIGVVLILIILPKGKAIPRRSSESIFTNMRKAIRNRNLILASIIGALAFIATIGNISFLSATLSDMFGYEPKDLGIILAISGIAGIFVSPWAGALTDRCSPRLSVIVGLAIAAPAIALLAFSTEFYHFITLIAIAGGGGTFIWAGLLTLTIEEIPALRGTCSSIFNSSRFSGYAVSVVLLGPIFLVFGFAGIAFASAMILVSALIMATFLTGKSCLSGRKKALLGVKTEHPGI